MSGTEAIAERLRGGHRRPDRPGRGHRPRLRRPAAGRAVRRRRVPRPRLRHRPERRSSSSRPAGATSATSPRRGSRRCATAAASRPRPTSPGWPSADAILICVPTPLGPHREPDLAAVVGTGRAIGRHLRPGQLVVLESTTYPGTTRDVLRPELEAGGLVAGRDFFLAYSPEREDPGNADVLGPATSPRSSAACDAASGAAGARRSTARSCREVVPVSLVRGGRGLQDPGEHLPGREHRPGQRAEAGLRADGDRRLGGHRRGQDQAVRLPGVLPRPGPRRALHPDRPVLPDLGGPRATACTRGSSSWPARSTRRCRTTSSSGSPRP